MDNDSKTLEEIAQSITIIDLKYRALSFPEKMKLKPERDKAFSKYVEARIKLLEEGIITTEEQISEMRQIRNEIDDAAETQAIIVAIARLVGFIATL